MDRILSYLMLAITLVAVYPQSLSANSAGERATLDQLLADTGRDLRSETGVYVLEKGEESLVGRAWLTEHATKSIDVQYFIWSTDNIGTLAAEALLRAAERGVRVRVIVDDLLVDAAAETLLALASHPRVQIKIYNPRHSVGVDLVSRLFYLLTEFRSSNQRMHDKTAIFDGRVGITGGRNMADEYYDFDHDYIFRDRDILLMGAAVRQMSRNFDEFWQSSLSHDVETIFTGRGQRVSPVRRAEIIDGLHQYANEPANFAPDVRHAIATLPEQFPFLFEQMTWSQVRFISDQPGKNDGSHGLKGGGASTSALLSVLRSAKRSITIQSPYLIMPEGGVAFFRDKVAAGVRVKIITNSLASTDNLSAFSGYAKIRSDLLAAGIEVFEFKPQPQIQNELVARRFQQDVEPPVFALHAKTLVVDGETLFIGTFNLDPRSVNLNTEVGALLQDQKLASQVERTIFNDMQAHSSWRISEQFDPDAEAGWIKRLKVMALRALPLDPIL